MGVCEKHSYLGLCLCPDRFAVLDDVDPNKFEGIIFQAGKQISAAPENQERLELARRRSASNRNFPCAHHISQTNSHVSFFTRLVHLQRMTISADIAGSNEKKY